MHSVDGMILIRYVVHLVFCGWELSQSDWHMKSPPYVTLNHKLEASVCSFKCVSRVGPSLLYGYNRRLMPGQQISSALHFSKALSCADARRWKQKLIKLNRGAPTHVHYIPMGRGVWVYVKSYNVCVRAVVPQRLMRYNESTVNMRVVLYACIIKAAGNLFSGRSAGGVGNSIFDALRQAQSICCWY